MLDSEIEQKLEDWQNNLLIPNQSKNYKINGSPFNSSEFLIIINISFNLKYSCNDNKISVVKFFNTFAQSVEDETINKKGDVYRLKIVLDDIDKMFEQKLNEKINEIIEQLERNITL